MFPHLPGAPAVAALISVIPAAVGWWWGRALALLADDPLLPERLVANNRRRSAVAGGCAALLVIGWPSWSAWTLPLLMVSQAAGGFPLHKTLHRETWSLGSYLSFFGRLALAAFGFWVLLAITPLLASQAGAFDWVAAAGLGLVLLTWNRYSAEILRALLRTRPIADPTILARFAALVTKAGLPMPRFEYVAMNGGVLANAVALPSLRGSSVVFTDTLLSRLSGDETVAICAHELAHLEYYDRVRLRRMNVANILLIVSAVAIAPMTRLLPDVTELSASAMIWPGLLLIALILRAKHRQKNETVSDLRAVALTGDPDALARGLTTLYAIARVPRRWDQERERQATHPSLARRIRDIRSAAGVAATTLDAPSSFRAATGTTAVTFDQTHLSWQEGPGTTHLLDYPALVELRLHASATGVVSLVAVERHGRRWQMSPEAKDLPALQAVLDVVDGGLSHATRSPAFPVAVPRLVAGLGWALGFLLGQFAFGFVALLAALSPASSLLTGAGAAALAAAAVIFRDASSPTVVTSAVILTALGMGLLALGWTRRDETTRGAAPLLGVLAVCSVLAIVMIGLGGPNPIRLHQASRSAPAVTVLLVGLAGACWTLRRRTLFRYAAVAAALGGLSAGVMGSTQFLDRIGRDPFLVEAPPVTRTTLNVPAFAEFDVPFDAETLRLSPHGRLAALVPVDADDTSTEPAPRVFHVGQAGGTLSAIEAADIAFVDDHRALVFAVHAGAAEVRDLGFDGPPAIAWRQQIPDLRSGALTYDGRSNRWTVLGRDGAGQFVRVAGTVGDSRIERTTWGPLPRSAGWVAAMSARGSALLAVENRYSSAILGRAPFLLSIAPLLIPIHSQAQLWRLRDGQGLEAGRSLLDTACVSDAPNDDRLVCSAFDGTRTRIVAVDPESGSVSALAMLDGRFRTDAVTAPGWLTGWSGSSPVALRLSTREAIRPPVPAHQYVHLVTATDAVLGTVAWEYNSCRVRLYALPGPSQARTRPN